MGGFPLTPDQASTVAGPVDALFYTLVGLSLLFALPIALLIVYFAVKYRRGSRASRAGQTGTSVKLELAWMIIPAFLSLGIFGWAANVYFDMARPPAGAIDIYVVGKQWMWKFQHPEGQREINELHVPVGHPVKLLMASEDVIHSFYVPAFRIKQDVLPGRYTTIWFQATAAGEYHLFCAEYCGTDHAVMGGKVIVMEQSDYESWLSGGVAGAAPQSPESLAASGQQLFTSLGCGGCHRMDGSGPGPSLAGVFGKPVPLQGDGTTTADEQYVRDSILTPQKQVVAGYQPIMPSFQGRVSEDQLAQLIAYIKSLGNQPGTRGGPTTQPTQVTP
jgi:cytochrome c oxidase subunit II